MEEVGEEGMRGEVVECIAEGIVGVAEGAGQEGLWAEAEVYLAKARRVSV